MKSYNHTNWSDSSNSPAWWNTTLGDWLFSCVAGWVAGWPDGRMAGWPGGRMAGWPVGRVAGWPGGRVAGCLGGRMARWPGGRMAGWPDGRVPDGRVAGWPGGRISAVFDHGYLSAVFCAVFQDRHQVSNVSARFPKGFREIWLLECPVCQHVVQLFCHKFSN